jgi:predicted acylesterase/phospholipase RssA
VREEEIFFMCAQKNRKVDERFRPFLDFIKNKRVYLALSGGGLALVCHIAIIRIIEELGISVERVYGTSAGSVVGGLYAAGMNSLQLTDAVSTLKNPDDLFGRGSRHMLLRALKCEFRSFIRGTTGATSIYDGERLERFITRRLIELFGNVPRMGDLRIPFSAVAFNVGSGTLGDSAVSSKAVFSTEETPTVSLSDAIVASIAIPGVFPAKKINGFYYIDGGVVEHLPIVCAYEDWQKQRRFYEKNLAILAVNLGYAGDAIQRIENVRPQDMILLTVGILGKALDRSSMLRVHRPRKGSHVVLVKPRCYDIGLTDFDKIPHAMEKAYTTVKGQLEGEEFMAETNKDLQKARQMLGIDE